jgi:putative hydrolase of the HAD superfamily
VSWSGFAPCEAIFFDLDDTLVDFDGPGLARACWELACAEAAPSIGVSAAQLQEACEGASSWYWSDPERHRQGRLDLLAATAAIVDQALEASGSRDPAHALVIATRYRSLRDQRLALLDGAIETIVELASAGYALGLITNGEALTQRAKIERFSLARYFAYIGIEGEVGVGKPDEEAYLRALHALGCSPSDAWMVGDNLVWDIIGAQRVGLRAVWVDRRREGLPPDCGARPDHVVRAVRELLLAGA